MSPGSATAIGIEPAGRSAPVWWLLLKQELLEMWAGGRVLILLAVFSVLMSVTAFLLATNNELNLLPIKQTVVVALTSTITFGLFIGLVIGAESISGERERATLEPLLLTPSSHRQIVLGKFLAAMSPWPAALIVSVPYVVTLAHGDPVLGKGLFWGSLTGSLLAVAFVGFGMLMSIWSDSSRVSLFVCLLAYAASLIPAQLPTEFLSSPAGVLISALDPVQASSVLLSRTLTEGRPLGEVWLYLLAPAAVTVLVLGLLFSYAAPRLRLTAGE
jgi:ABC-2 type transport system permease protein